MARPTIRKYPVELLAPIVARSKSVADVLGELGLCKSGGTHSHISKRIKEYGLDTSHFVRYPNRGLAHKGGFTKVTVEEMSVYNRRKGYREDRSTLLRLMIESGQAYSCAGLGCEVSLTWNGVPITLEIDHINRDYFDNRMENLQFLCPNCHSQTVGFSGRRGTPKMYQNRTSRAPKAQKDNFCQCGTKIGVKAIKCAPCHQKVLHAAERPVKGTWPADEELQKLLWERPALQVAKDIGVSSVAVKKWCRNRNIPTPPRGYWAKKYARNMDG